MSTSSTPLEERVVVVLRRYLGLLKAGDAVPLDEPLRELGLTSMSAISLLLDLETAFGIAIPDSLLDEEMFRTARSLSKVVARAIEGGGSS